MNETVLNDAVATLNVLTRVKPNWLSVNQFQLGLSRRRMHKALRFLQEHNMVQSRLEGFNEDRYKTYRAYQAGYPALVLPQEVAQ